MQPSAWLRRFITSATSLQAQGWTDIQIFQGVNPTLNTARVSTHTRTQLLHNPKPTFRGGSQQKSQASPSRQPLKPSTWSVLKENSDFMTIPLFAPLLNYRRQHLVRWFMSSREIQLLMLQVMKWKKIIQGRCLLGFFLFWTKSHLIKEGILTKETQSKYNLVGKILLAYFTMLFTMPYNGNTLLEVINFPSYMKFIAGENNLKRAYAYLCSEKLFENRWHLQQSAPIEN